MTKRLELNTELGNQNGDGCVLPCAKFMHSSNCIMSAQLCAVSERGVPLKHVDLIKKVL